MTVAGLAIDASSRNPIVLLRDPSGCRQVPIWISHEQAHTIMAGIENAHQGAPLTHDLIISILKAGNLELDRIVIHSIEEGKFQAVIRIRLKNSNKTKAGEGQSKFIELNSRPSDAIALAIRSRCSIWMHEKVVVDASMPVDAEADEKEQDKFRHFIDNISPADLIRHLEDKANNSENSEEKPNNNETKE